MNAFYACLKADEDVARFIEEEHTFEEYSKELLKYHRLVDEITYNSIKVCGKMQLNTYFGKQDLYLPQQRNLARSYI